MEPADSIFDILVVLGFSCIFAIVWFVDQVRVKGVRAASSRAINAIRAVPHWIATEWF